MNILQPGTRVIVGSKFANEYSYLPIVGMEVRIDRASYSDGEFNSYYVYADDGFGWFIRHQDAITKNNNNEISVRFLKEEEWVG